MATWKQEPPGNNLLEFARTANAGAPKRRSAPPSPASTRPAPPSVPPASAAPAVMEDAAPVILNLGPSSAVVARRPEPPEEALPVARSSRGSTALVVIAGFSGLLISLYRNDVLHDVVHSTRFEGPLTGVEHAFGSPGFGTPRSLDAILYTPHEVPAAAPSLPAAAGSPVDGTGGAVPDAPPVALDVAAASAAADSAEPRRALSSPSGSVHGAAPRASAAPARHARVATSAKHAAADSAPAVSLSDDAPAPAAHAESKKKVEAKDSTPAPSLDDAIRAAMKH